MSEKVLGIIQGMGQAHGKLITEVLFFTPYRMIVAETSSTGSWTAMLGVVPAVIDAVRSEKRRKKKEEEYLELPVEDILKGKNSFDVPYSEITKVELKKKWRGGLEIKMEIMDEEIEGKTYWGKWVAMGIPEKDKATIEDYENMLSPIFEDKLSVKK